MNLWLKHVDEVVLLAPKINKSKSLIDISYKHDNLNFKEVSLIEFTNVKQAFLSLFKLPLILFKIFKACKSADHIHLRCPGNIGLLGCLVQMLFPNKVKTAKYAGNWDPGASQPLSYKFQKWILSNTILTKKMKVLVYGDWKNQSKNIKPFFTATYSNEERVLPKVRDYSGCITFLFVGGLVEGKRPLFAIQIVEALMKKGVKAQLCLYGDGVLKSELQKYIAENNLGDCVKLCGNQNKDTVKKALQNAHFLILPSKSEGWPKAIAEAMFFGVLPISTSVSCVPFMLDYGKRGVLIDYNLKSATETVLSSLSSLESLKSMSKNAFKWSQNYTLDVFETEIIKLLEA
jgi:glycosyltransferase involved in cell wall biosynthesis